MTFVRVRLPNGYEASLSEAHAKNEGLAVLDEPATNVRGMPLPATRKDGRPIKPRVSVDELAANKAAAHAWLQRAAVAFGNTTQTGGDAEGGTPA